MALALSFSIVGFYISSMDWEWSHREWRFYHRLDFYLYWLASISRLVIILSRLSIRFFPGSHKARSLSKSFFVNFYLVLIFFSSNHIVVFYLLFEISVIPIFLMVTGWGYQPERVKASYAIIFYTIVSSVPLIICILLVVFLNSINQIRILELSINSGSLGTVLFLCIRIGFLVKLPIYGVHLWLPLAHVEAPVYGSIILAGILLKLGGLGVIRLSSLLNRNCCFNGFIIVSLLGTVLVGLTCLKITDLKSVIAFSSVAHIGIVIIILMFGTKLFAWTAVFIMLTHAFSSSYIFYGSYVIYIIRGTRNILLNKGGVRVFPRFTLCWLIAVIARIGTPPFINLASEVYCLILSTKILGVLGLFLILIFILGSCYHLILYRSSQQEFSRWDFSSIKRDVTRLSLVVRHFHRLVLVLSLLCLVSLGY